MRLQSETHQKMKGWSKLTSGSFELAESAGLAEQVAHIRHQGKYGGLRAGTGERRNGCENRNGGSGQGKPMIRPAFYAGQGESRLDSSTEGGGFQGYQADTVHRVLVCSQMYRWSHGRRFKPNHVSREICNAGST